MNHDLKNKMPVKSVQVKDFKVMFMSFNPRINLIVHFFKNWIADDENVYPSNL